MLPIRYSRVPYIVLHNDDQTADLRRFCCGGYTINKTVIGVDITFYLSDLHVTVTVYKNLSLLSRRSGPVFLMEEAGARQLKGAHTVI